MSGISVNWNDFYQDYRYCKVDVPSYPFQRKRYWLDNEQNNYEDRGKKPVENQKPLVEQIKQQSNSYKEV